MTTIPNIQEKDLKKIHFDMLTWKSSLQFIQEEVLFINQLLHSYVFEPTTPNLFERLQEYKQEIENMGDKIKKLQKDIQKQESELGGMLECDTVSCDHYYYNEHETLKKIFQDFYKSSRELKLEIFNYAGSILKNKKK